MKYKGILYFLTKIYTHFNVINDIFRVPKRNIYVFNKLY